MILLCAGLPSELEFVGRDSRIRTAVCGPGKLAAAMALLDALENEPPDAIVVVGTAGALVDAVRIDDVVVAEWVREHDLPDLAGAPVRTPAGDWTEVLISAAREDGQRSVHRGGVLTGDVLITNREIISRPHLRQTDALAVDMETAAIAAVADRAGIPWAAARVITDRPFENRRVDFRARVSAAARMIGALAGELAARHPL